MDWLPGRGHMVPPAAGMLAEVQWALGSRHGAGKAEEVEVSSPPLIFPK